MQSPTQIAVCFSCTLINAFVDNVSWVFMCRLSPQEKRLSGGSTQSAESQRSGSTVSAGYHEERRNLVEVKVDEPEEEEENPADDMEVEYMEVTYCDLD